MAEHDDTQGAKTPLVLIVPGLDNSGPDHWQSRWEREIPGSRRVELGMWDNPHRNTWVNKLNHAILAADRPVILVAHSLGCHAVAWWTAYERPAQGHPVAAALLVAPPDVEGVGVDERIRRFAPLVGSRLPFRTTLVASSNDPYATFGQARRMARKWGSRLVDAGPLGHINAHSGIGNWPYGLFLLDQLPGRIAPAERPVQPAARRDRATDAGAIRPFDPNYLL